MVTIDDLIDLAEDESLNVDELILCAKEQDIDVDMLDDTDDEYVDGNVFDDDGDDE